jgi:hypothetical protein
MALFPIPAELKHGNSDPIVNGPPYACPAFRRLVNRGYRKWALDGRLRPLVPYRGHGRAPRVVAAFAGLVHDRQSAAEYERNYDNNSCYGGIHCNLPASGGATCAVSAEVSRSHLGLCKAVAPAASMQAIRTPSAM